MNQENQDGKTDITEIPNQHKETQNFTFWSGVSVSLAFIAAQIIVAIVVAVALLFALGAEAENFMNIIMGITLIFAFPVAVWIVLRKRSLEASAWNWNSTFWILLPITLLMVSSMSYMTGILMELLPNYKDMMESYSKMFEGMNKTLLLIGGGIIGPICEEIIFRGIILKGFLKSYDYKKAIILSAVIFSVIHLVAIQMIATFFIGIILGYIYYKTRSLWLVVIIHVLNNMLAFIIGTENILLEETTRESFNNDLLFFGTVVLASIMLYISYILFERYQVTTVYSESNTVA